ncbi:hypothetical protein, partial [Curtobacterium sp. Leaf183]|uniref:hypothetical protein n=1 Tax=Curtobacterium sp. Leaf183 TaxID=1736291 RepID=UPI00191101EE
MTVAALTRIATVVAAVTLVPVRVAPARPVDPAVTGRRRSAVVVATAVPAIVTTIVTRSRTGGPGAVPTIVTTCAPTVVVTTAVPSIVTTIVPRSRTGGP